MVAPQPHFLLFSAVECDRRTAGRWHFVLESLHGDTVVEASDAEPGLQGERLELLSVVRGLEALDQPSRVTLVTPCRQVSRGLRFGLEEWRSNNWQWERDGRWVPVKNRDLWQRIDQALRFHRVDCRTWRIDAAHTNPSPARSASGRVSGSRWSRAVSWTRRLLNWSEGWFSRLARAPHAPS